ncbi:C40 family peptidase [Liquorilactobacillus mali]|uniref:C40 family peptidase n=1 Tax=Liquorilactobacillus mali TaxID=1618 RepID=UPI00295315E8|nr:LysM peptidoglycan-binding domain-containing protein [Liquorilactobacillus mali]MDV7758755.1 LysM peptidoglycan-binding domain-containing protein [Liquorilactobacillus mali]
MKRTTKTLLASTVGAAGLFLASTTNASASTTVKVNKNDTVWGLSQKYGVSIKSIEALNNINENSHLIIESQTLTIPDSDNTSNTADSSSTSSSATSTVSVAKGDSLWAIAQKYGTTVDSLRSLNGLSSTETLIKPGQTLKVDGSADTSSSDTNNTNNESTTTTESSTTTTTTTNSTTTTTPSVTVSSNHVTYTVKSGDSLYTIARAYGVTVASLRSSNTLGSAILPGQTLTINDPTKTPSTTATTAANESSDSSASAATTAASSSTTAATSTAATTAASSSTTAAASSTTATTASAANSSAATVASSSSVAATPSVSSSTASAAATTTASSTASSTASTSAAVSTSSVVSYATYLASLKIPYVYGGTSLSGFDCSGFVQYVYAHFGVSLPRTSEAQSTIGTAVPVSQAKAGDLIFWGSQGSSWHVGIYIGGSSYVAAPSSGQTVSVKSFQYFQPSFAIHMN